jgi:Mechanosensitive ion channel/Conserved TM helix
LVIYVVSTEISAVCNKIQGMANDFIILLPNIVLALIVFAIFFFIARTLKGLVKRLTRDRRQAHNLGLVLGRLAQGATILMGLFIALSIVIPSLKASDLVQLLGISGVAIGFAFRDILQNFLAGILIHDQTEATDGDRRQQREGWPAGTGEVPKPFGIGRTIGKLAQSEARPNIVLAGNGTSNNQTPTQDDR